MENIAAFAGVPVPPSIHLTCDIQQAASADIVVMAVPSFAIRESAAKLQGDTAGRDIGGQCGQRGWRREL